MAYVECMYCKRVSHVHYGDIEKEKNPPPYICYSCWKQEKRPQEKQMNIPPIIQSAILTVLTTLHMPDGMHFDVLSHSDDTPGYAHIRFDNFDLIITDILHSNGKVDYWRVIITPEVESNVTFLAAIEGELVA